MLSPDATRNSIPWCRAKNGWKARKAHLKNEKALTRMRDLVNAERRALPWVKVEKEYVFDTPDGKKTLAELFGSNSQLIVYHFMWRWDLGQGCDELLVPGRSRRRRQSAPGPSRRDLRRDLARQARRPASLQEAHGLAVRPGLVLRQRLQLRLSRLVHQGELAKGEIDYNYERIDAKGFDELPGPSVFYKDENGDVFHTYSCYGRGGDILIGAYNFLDLTPKGRNEKGIMDWVKRHDEYEPRQRYAILLPRLTAYARQSNSSTERSKGSDRCLMSTDLWCRSEEEHQEIPGIAKKAARCGRTMARSTTSKRSPTT